MTGYRRSTSLLGVISVVEAVVLALFLAPWRSATAYDGLNDGSQRSWNLLGMPVPAGGVGIGLWLLTTVLVLASTIALTVAVMRRSAARRAAADA